MSWKTVKLEDLTENGFMVDGDWIESKDQDPTGGIRLLQLADIGDGYFINKSNRFINLETSKRLKCTFLKTNDILIARMPDPIGRACIFPFKEENKYITVVDVCIMRIKSGVDPKYVMYAINSSGFRNKIESQITGTTRQRISGKKLKNLQIPLHPLATQKRIAEILDAADALRRKDQELLKKYDELAQAIFIDMFGDPVKNEKGWEKVELSYYIAHLETGVSVNSNDDKFDSNKKCVLKTSCVYTGYFNSAEAKVIVPMDLVRAKLNPVKDSIIISRMNTSELVGMSAYIDNDYPNLYLPDRLWMTIKSNNTHSSLWLSFALKSHAIREQIQKIASGTSGSMKNISKKDFLEIKIINPPYSLQRTFEDALMKINDLKKYEETNKGNMLFNSLIQKAFKGELVK